MRVKPSERRLKLRIVGVSCATCIIPIRKSLERIVGVKWVGANVVLDLILVDYDSDLTDKASIVAAVKITGYDAIPVAS